MNLPLIILVGMCNNFTFTAKIAPYEYTKKDRDTAKHASLVCKDRYKGCLLSLTRKKGIHYNAICQ